MGTSCTMKTRRQVRSAHICYYAFTIIRNPKNHYDKNKTVAQFFCGQCFIRYTNGLFESIQELKFSWCKVITYKKVKLGGWDSTSYFGMA